MLNHRQRYSYRWWSLFFQCFIVIVCKKVFCFCVMGNRLAADDGWPSAIHACKGDGKTRLLDQDKRWGLKAKEKGLLLCRKKGSLVVR